MSDNVRVRIRPEAFSEGRSKVMGYLQPGRIYRATHNAAIRTWYVDGAQIGEKMIEVVQEPDFTMELHQSDVDALWSCPRRFYYGKIKGLRTAKKPSYFTVGEIYHFGVALARHPYNANFVKEDLFARIEAVYGGKASGEEMQEALKYLGMWVEHCGKDPLKHKVVQVETPLTYRFPEWPEGYGIGGTMDAVLQEEHNPAMLWIGEWKTAGRADVGYFRSLRNGPQPAWYYLLLLHNLTYLGLHNTEAIRGHIYEIYQKNSTPPVKREMSILDNTMFVRGIEFSSDSVQRAAAIIKEARFERVLSSCYGKYNTECPYMPWCYRKGEAEKDHEDLLGTMYTVKDPAEALKERQLPSSFYDLSSNP